MLRRSAYWLGAACAGACIALGGGYGVAAAATDSSHGAGSASQPAAHGSAGAAEGTDASANRATKRATDPPSSKHREPRVKLNEVLSRHRRSGPSTSATDRAPTDPRRHSAAAARAGKMASVQSSTASATNPRTPGPVAAAVSDVLSALGGSARPKSAADFPPLTQLADTTAQATAAPTAGSSVTGVKTGHATLTIPVGSNGYTTRADWYFPTQASGSVSATGVIWLQHGFLNRKSFVSALAATLAQQTNSIVVAPNVSSFPLRCAGCWLNGAPTQQAVATMFLGDRLALNTSATAAGYLGELPQDFVLSGQSAGGGFATAVGGYYAADPTNSGSLRGVVMFDGFAFGGVVPNALQSLNDPHIPVYQVAAPPQLWNMFGATTNELVAARPDEFVGATLAGGSHADALLGSGPLIDLFVQLVTKFSPPGNTAAVYTLATGWINDLYQGLGPTDGTGIYGYPDQFIVLGDASAVVLGPPPVVDLTKYLDTWYEVGSVKQFFSIGLVNTKAVYTLNPDGSIRVENSGNYFFNNGPESTIVGSALPVDDTDNKLNVTFFGPASAKPPGNYWIVDLDPDYQWAIVSDRTGRTGFLLSRTPTVSDDFYAELLDRASVKGVKGRITPTRQPAAGPTTVSV
ncbi:lipocalin family protein [Mycolicibacterium hodleri]|uniref:Lipocalin n=1 Tax=Mycolicibacterium hodleri TaxID=49897 RepID=A0A502DV94_9MYCO|nr:lipocalin family protein [Mycolicibacterium hodleri]TPG28242.1 lipocalin [Mycolicibacterium hodleri]